MAPKFNIICYCVFCVSDIMEGTLSFSQLPIFQNRSSISWNELLSLQWRHTGCDSVSNHQPHDCLRWPVNSPHKGPVTRKMFPFEDGILMIIMLSLYSLSCKKSHEASKPRDWMLALLCHSEIGWAVLLVWRLSNFRAFGLLYIPISR